MLVVDHLSFQHRGQSRLADVSFRLNSGEILGIIGPNGAGKSTLLQLLMAELPPTSGSLHWDGLALPSIALGRRAKAIAMLPQQSHLNFPFPVESVVLLGRTPHSTGQKKDIQIVDELMNRLDITHLYGRCYTTLSGGERQRVQLARVFAQIWRAEDADIARLLVLDEPNNSLDLGHKQQVMSLVQEFAKTGVAIAIIEHDLNLVAGYCGQLLALKEGGVSVFGELKTVLSAALIKDLLAADIEIVERNGRWVVLS